MNQVFANCSDEDKIFPLIVKDTVDIQNQKPISQIPSNRTTNSLLGLPPIYFWGSNLQVWQTSIVLM